MTDDDRDPAGDDRDPAGDDRDPTDDDRDPAGDDRDPAGDDRDPTGEDRDVTGEGADLVPVGDAERIADSLTSTSVELAENPASKESETIRAIEAILMVADEPVTPQLIGELLEVPPSHIEALCEQMSERFAAERRGFVLVRTAGGYRFQSHPDLAPYVERFVLGGQAARLSAAALETLAIVAYKQPISRAQVASIRGVNSDAVMKTLVQRGYVAEVATDPGPGQAVLFGTTELFLEKLALDSLRDLPPLGDLVPNAEVMEALEATLRIDGETGRTVRGPLDRTLGSGQHRVDGLA